MDTEIDPLDRMLADAAPRGVDPRPGLRPALGVMAQESRAAAAPRARRRMRVAVGAMLAAVLVGGAGAAVAGTAFTWAPWAADPDIVYSFTLPSGRACEERVQVLRVTAVDEYGRVTSEYDSALADHFRGIDMVARIDTAAAAREVESWSDARSMVAITPDGRVGTVPVTAGGPTADDRYAAAIWQGMGAALHAEFDAMGWTDAEWNTQMDLQCAPVTP